MAANKDYQYYEDLLGDMEINNSHPIILLEPPNDTPMTYTENRGTKSTLKSYEVPVVSKENKINDVSEFIGTLKGFKQLVDEHDRDQLAAMFDVGVLIFVSKNKEVTFRELGNIGGIPYPHLSIAQTIARLWKCDKVKFMEHCANENINSWRQALKEFGPMRKRRKNRLGKKIHEVYLTMIALHDNAKNFDANKEEYDAMVEILQKCAKYVPAKKKLTSPHYLKYQDCVCCGMEPPRKGHLEKHHPAFDWLKYPVCEKCSEEKKQPDWERVAKIYACYAIDLENALDKL